MGHDRHGRGAGGPVVGGHPVYPQRWAVVGHSLNTTPEGAAWPVSIATLWGSGNGTRRTITNYAVGGATAAEVVTQYNTSVKNQGFYGLVAFGGYNTLNTSATAQEVFDILDAIYSDAYSAGLKLVVISEPPTRSLSSVTIVTKVRAFNTLLQSSSRGQYVNWFDFVNDGADSSSATYTSDAIHPNAAGATALAGLVDAKLP